MNLTRKYTGQIIVSFFIFINIFIWSAVFANERGGMLTVSFFDVGQGDAIFIEAPNGNQILIDGGPNSSVLRELSKVMPFQDRSIDVVVATHPDKDHISGLINVFERYNINAFLYSGVIHNTGEYKTLLDSVGREGLTPIPARRGMKIILSGGVFVEILFPDRDVSNVETNLGSVMMRVVYGDTEFMLTGDSPKVIEKYLISLDGSGLKSDVLKAGHHGSRTSNSENFIRFVSPIFAVISAGKDNKYGHPNADVMDIFKKLGIKTISTIDVGTIIFTSDGTSVKYKK